jgi:hypothetical protein
MSDNLLTEIELTQAKLNAAREKRRKYSALEGRLSRQLSETDRKLASQIKFTLGGALLRAVEHDPRPLETLRKFILPHVTRLVDQDCLTTTPFRFPLLTDAPNSEN